MGTEENDSFTIGRLYYMAEEAIEDSGIECTILQPNFCMQDFLHLAGDTLRNRCTRYLTESEPFCGNANVLGIPHSVYGNKVQLPWPYPIQHLRQKCLTYHCASIIHIPNVTVFAHDICM
jgi:hypothetical protein